MPHKKKIHPETAPESAMPTALRIMESGEFEWQMAKYARDMGSIPAMLGDILREAVAIRLLLEEQR